MPSSQWAGRNSELCRHIESETRSTLEGYRSKPDWVTEHANAEEDTARGGYAGRQLFELIQNAADAIALLNQKGGGHVEIRLTPDHLYCADNGAPIDKDGVRALLNSHLSPKRGTAEIGRFGLGFKSVLGVTDSPEFFSRAGSFHFDRCLARQEIRKVLPNAERCPVLRLAFPLSLGEEIKIDRKLRNLSKWASNIVRLPLHESGYEKIVDQIKNFPGEFLLFVKHVKKITLRIFDSKTAQNERSVSILKSGNEYHIIDSNFHEEDGKKIRRWMLFDRVHTLSNDARSDRRSLDDNDQVPIHWAVPLDRLDRPGDFWAFFPTMTQTRVAGILNAPWKTNEDRQNLLSGTYNAELIGVAAALIVDSLHQLSSESDPARHLDALPGREEDWDSEQVRLLRDNISATLTGRSILPDQNGDLHPPDCLNYPPREFIRGRQTIGEPLSCWAAFSDRPDGWLHHRAITVNRRAAIDRLFEYGGAPAASIARWLEALVKGRQVEDGVEASKAAVQTAAAIPSAIRPGVGSLGRIVLSANGEWREPNPEHLFLPDSDAVEDAAASSLVHSALADDQQTREALEALGLRQVSPESRFRMVTGKLMNPYNIFESEISEQFWIASRQVQTEFALSTVKSFTDSRKKYPLLNEIHVKSILGNWNCISKMLMPGMTFENSDDNDVIIDIKYHHQDIDLLNRLGATDKPVKDYDLSTEKYFDNFRDDCRIAFRKDCILKSLPKTPQKLKLNFEETVGVGPTEILCHLSDDGRSAYTNAILLMEGTYKKWTMRHDTEEIYGAVRFPAPTVAMLMAHGRIRTSTGVVPFADAVGEDPKNLEATRVLLEHPMADRIKEAFDLPDVTSRNFGQPEIADEEEAIPLLDEWPGLDDHFREEQKSSCLIRCGRIRAGGEWECFSYGSNLYLLRGIEERCALRLIAKELKLSLDETQIDLILRRETPGEIRGRREAVRQGSSDAARLLKAVGEPALRSKLPASLLDILKSQNGPLTGVQVAEAAIATFHTDSLRQYREYLQHLDPPYQWAGSKRAVRFVEALGFPVEWAGEKSRRRDPFMEVDGPLTLPKLHLYQRRIVANVRRLLRFGSRDPRRGMISMPTGSGKTRVAVQAVIEALREGELAGGVLWVADRDELCEQAVEAWSQVWVSKGARRERLRISRLWQGQPDPLRTPDRHVVVASVQTLASRIERRPDDYAFLADVALVVFDEAHRSIAPSYTGVMRELGMAGRRRRPDEPFLIGLTATPYRGYNQEETDWLVRRYGSRRLDEGAFKSDDPQQVVGELQQMQVLAEVDQEEIDGGSLNLNDEELGQMLGVPWLPQSAEDRIAQDSQRTMRIVEAFETHIESGWPTLIFATSVEHAQTLAAILSGRGVTARAISGQTENRVRRRIVEEFRNGDIHALVNYGVLREGFDAPKTRAIIVARPVYSPNLYFQMIGRGLRGPLNGGDDRCLILNVRDNIENFDRQLAFAELDWLWR